MALTRTEIDREYLKRHNLKRFNLMASEETLVRFKALAESTSVRVGEMLTILIDAYTAEQQAAENRNQKKKLSSLVVQEKKNQMSLF